MRNLYIFVIVFVTMSGLIGQVERGVASKNISDITAIWFIGNKTGDPVQLSSYVVRAAIPERTYRLNESMMRELERRWSPRRASSQNDARQSKITITNDRSSLPSILEDLIVLSNDIAVKYRGGYQLTNHGVLYLNGGVMYSPRKYSGAISYGVTTIHHNTGPAIRYRW